MASLTIKNIPDDLYEHLKQAAQAHHRSVNSEIIHCLERALLPNKLSSTELKDTARALRERIVASSFDADQIMLAKNQGRP